jgi:FkbH-like protein
MSGGGLHLVSDFNVDLLASSLRASLGSTRAISTAPFGQVYQTFLGANSRHIDQQTTLVVWTRPEAVFESFRRVLMMERVDHATVLSEVEGYVQGLRTLAASCRYVLHPTWTIANTRRLYGPLDLKPGLGVRHLVACMNLALTRCMEDSSNIYVLDANAWLQSAGAKAYAPKFELIAKAPFAPPVFVAAAATIGAALDAFDGKARKLVVVDLDNTLWGGVVGDDGPAGLRLGGHDHVGEAYVTFQRALLALTHRGVQLAIVSKNEERIAFDVIDSHPEMVLRRDHFAGWRINWNDKAGNIAELANELRLGLQSFVFIDDNPVERARVSSALPEVLVPDWPADPSLYATTLEALDCFDVAQITAEDFERTAAQVAERHRQASMSGLSPSSFGDWLTSLETSVHVEALSSSNLSRVTQLFNKTNQMNLTTRRLSSAEIDAWSRGPGRHVWAIRVRDRFGDSGLTGVISIEIEGRIARVVDLILSCRVMGRQVEYAMLHLASAFAWTQDVDELQVEYRRSDRNAPCLQVLEASGLAQRSGTLFVWTGDQAYALPAAIALEHDAVAS